MSSALLKQSRSTMPKIAPFEDIQASLRDAGHIWRFQTRAEARVYVRLPLLRQGQTSQPSLIESVLHLDKWVGREGDNQPSALADYERSPAIYRRVSLEKERLVA